jgi:hypothetical protein
MRKRFQIDTDDQHILALYLEASMARAQVEDPGIGGQAGEDFRHFLRCL